MRNIEKYYIVETKVLGEGMTAKVKLAIDMKSGERLAVKIIDKGVLSKQNKLRASITDYIAQEIKILKNIAHPNIVALRDVIETTSDVYIFMPLVKGGELCDYVKHRSSVLDAITTCTYLSRTFFLCQGR